MDTEDGTIFIKVQIPHAVPPSLCSHSLTLLELGLLCSHSRKSPRKCSATSETKVRPCVDSFSKRCHLARLCLSFLLLLHILYSGGSAVIAVPQFYITAHKASQTHANPSPPLLPPLALLGTQHRGWSHGHTLGKHQHRRRSGQLCFLSQRSPAKEDSEF
jgi:hypothetical protein